MFQTCRLLVVTSSDGVVSDSDGGVAMATRGDSMTTAGVIVIAVVACVVMTSLVWFAVIYKSRGRRGGSSPLRTPTLLRSVDTVTAACDSVTCHRAMSSVSDGDGSAQGLLAYSSSRKRSCLHTTNCLNWHHSNTYYTAFHVCADIRESGECVSANKESDL